MSVTSLPVGFEVPIHRSLTEPILLGGAPRGVAILIGTCSAAFGLGLQQWLAGLLIWVVGHSGAVVAARQDADFMPVFLRHIRQPGYWAC
jgi:type IV secretion system protein TrbD